MRGRSLDRRGTGFAALAVLGLLMLGVVGCSAGGGSTPAAGGGGVQAPAADGDAAVPDEDRAVVIEGTMQIVVTDAPAATEAAAAIVQGAGGRIDGREEQDAGDGGGYATMILRIPAEGLDTALDRLRELGDVESLQTSTTDVTTAAQDLDARIAGLEGTIARLASFQKAATSVDDLLEIEKEITARQTELEDLRSKQAALDERIAFSTITLTLREERAPALVAPDSFWSGIGVGWNALVAFFGGLFVVLGVALPWLGLAAVVALVVIVLVRWTRRRKAGRAVERVAGVAGAEVLTEGEVPPESVAPGSVPPGSVPPGGQEPPR